MKWQWFLPCLRCEEWLGGSSFSGFGCRTSQARCLGPPVLCPAHPKVPPLQQLQHRPTWNFLNFWYLRTALQPLLHPAAKVLPRQVCGMRRPGGGGATTASVPPPPFLWGGGGRETLNCILTMHWYFYGAKYCDCALLGYQIT